MSQIAIAGAGLVGRLFAWSLARAGHQVQVFDARPGPEPQFDGQGAAAFTAAGMLSPLAELEQAPPAIARLGWRSLQLWPAICGALDTPVRLSREGSLLLAHRQDQGAAARVLHKLGQAGEGFPRPEPLEPEQLLALEPALHAPGLRAWRLAGEGLIHPLQAMAALYSNAREVRWHWQQAAIVVHHHRIELADGRRVDADWCIDARGLGARPALPLRGVRGEVVALELANHGLRRPLRLLHPRHRIYLVPRSEHELLIGASEIESEDRSAVSLQTAVELMAAAHSLLPQLGEARIVRLDRNLRPALPDNAPLARAEPGLIQLNGLYRHGWLLAPALVQQVLEQSKLATLETAA